MAAYNNPEVETNAAEHYQLADARSRGLGYGLDVTNNNPWENKTAIEVRRNVTPKDISLVHEPQKVNHYSRSLVNSKDLIFDADVQADVLRETVKVCMDTGFSRKHTYSQQVRGTRVRTCTVFFKVIPGDTSETSFERELREEINFDCIKEDGPTLVDACKEFVKKYSITHYSTAIMKGAVKYQVVRMNQQNSRFRTGLRATAVEALAPAAPVVAAQMEQSYASTKFSKDIHLEAIGELADDFTVTREEVIEIVIAPIHRLVRAPELADALQQAVQTYCREKLEKPAGPFFIVCRSGDKPLYLKENKAEEIIEGTTDKASATKFCIEQECENHPNKFAIKKFDEGNAAAYITNEVSITGRSPQNQPPKVTTANVTRENTRYSLVNQMQEEKEEIDADDWIRGKGWYYIRCARRHNPFKRGKLCVKTVRMQQGIRYQMIVVASCAAHNDKNMFMLFHLEPAT